MKFLLVFTMLMGTAFANEGWDIKCFEKDHHDFNLAYIVKVDHHDMESFNHRMELLDCTRSDNAEKNECRKRGPLKKIERQEESCLVLDHHNVSNGRFSLCYEEQETVSEPRRLVPVTVTDDRQESRIYCERSILRVL